MSKRKFILTLVCSFLIATLIFLVLYIPSKYVVAILMYHKIDQYSQVSKLSVTPESFLRQMSFLKKKGYNVISLEELLASMRQKKKLPSRTCVITFDDGYENNFTEAYPVLKRYHLPATIFIVTNWIGEPGYLTWDEIKQMADDGIDIGSHTRSHPTLTDLDSLTAWNEISVSKQLIEGKIGREVKFLSYPYGAFNQEVKGLVELAGYIGACATSPGKGFPKDDIYALKRVRISRTSDNLLTFWIETSGYYTWIKEIRDED